MNKLTIVWFVAWLLMLVAFGVQTYNVFQRHEQVDKLQEYCVKPKKVWV